MNIRHPLLTALRRTLLGFFGVPIVLGIIIQAIDSYRRRGKKAKPFPTRAPRQVAVGAGSVTTYTLGQDLYEDMLSAIAGAQKQIVFETYIWKGDAVGQRFKEALIVAADRGVDVHVVYDAFANLVVRPSFLKMPPNISALAYPIYPAGWRFFDLRRYGRDHRKMLVVDDEVAFIGGYNIGAPYATDWRDTHCRITGPAVWDVKRAFADMWNAHRKRRIRSSPQPMLLSTAAYWEPQIRVHRNSPRVWMFPIRAMYLEAFARARQNIWLTHAYFIPDDDFVDALQRAAERGVDVRLLLPAKSNHIVADLLSRGYFRRMLESGIEIYRFADAMVHAKTATIDGEWSTIGTANVDRLSMTGNYEINVEVIDQSLAQEMERIFETDLKQCRSLTLDEWESRDVYSRFTEIVLKPLRPFL